MKVKLAFLGAAQNVTGSRYLLEANGSRVLIDCGLHQERDLRGRNWDPFPVNPDSINAVLLTHAHLDHCGLLPKLVREGFRGRIFCTEATAEIARIVLLDSARIQEEDAAYKQRRHQREGRRGPRPVVPLYTIDDAQAAVSRFAPVAYDRLTKVVKGMEATFINVGHILGASAIQVRVAGGSQARTILFSGDVGRWHMPIIKDPCPIPEADYVVTESTYGDRTHPKGEDVEAELGNVIVDTKARGGNIIVPSFSLERCQDLLFHLNSLLLADRIPHLMVFVDSPMAINVTEVFQDHPELFDAEMAKQVNDHSSPFSFAGLKMTRSVQESKAINHIRGTVVIIAGSGMCTGGRVKHHLVNNIARPESTVLFIGYQAYGTLGHRISEGPKEVRILGRTHPIRARIARIHGFSAHADREELFRWLSGLPKAPRGVFVTHGEPDAANSYAQHITDKTGWPATVPAYKDEVVLD